MNTAFMKRAFLSFLLLLLVGNAISQGPDRELVAKVKKATVFLEVAHDHPLKEGSMESSGTGFFIDDHGRIVTNQHVISSWVSAMGLPYPAPVTRIRAYIHSGSDSVRKVPMRVLVEDQEQDLAILTPEEGMDEVPSSLDLVDNEELYETMSVWAFGYPYGKEHTVLANGPGVTVTKGNISALRRGDRDTLRSIQMDASVAPGNSGGPLITKEGGVVGVVFRKGENEMNQAVPSHYLARMKKRIPDRPLSSFLSLKMKSEPSGARLYIDGKSVGSTPLEIDSLKPGVHNFDLYLKGHRVAYDKLVLTSDTSLSRELEKFDPKPLIRGTSAVTGLEPPDLSTRETLLQEDFEDRTRFRTWDQNTGGLSERTWYIEEGQLRQYQRDGTLHAITLNEELGQAPYRIAARLRLPEEGSEGDDRAGLIFGDGPNGFYLFRIHRESNKAELAYHSRSPFGWSILQRKKLDLNLSADDWYELKVSVLGERVLCHLDGKKVIDLEVPALDGGGLGFYSVQSKPFFDSLRVDRLKIVQAAKGGQGSANTESFWFTDRFDRNSGWWWPSSVEQKDASAPFVGSVGTVLKADGKGWSRFGFQRYQLSEIQARAIVSTSKGGEDAAFECSFFERDDARTFLRISSDSLVHLIREEEGKEEVIAEDTMDGAFFGGPTLISLTIGENAVKFENRLRTVLEAELPGKMHANPGTLAFRLRDVKGIFHRMTVSSLDRSGDEAD